MSSRADLINDINAKLNDNTTGDITALDIREVVTDLVNACMNKSDDRMWGYVSTGTIINSGGLPFTASYLGSTTTRITHNLGHNDYTVMFDTNSTERRAYATLVNKKINYFEVKTISCHTGDSADYAFEFLLNTFI